MIPLPCNRVKLRPRKAFEELIALLIYQEDVYVFNFPHYFALE